MVHLRSSAWVVHLRSTAGVVQASKLRRDMTDAERRRTQNVIAHSAPGSVKVKPARKKKIVAELE